MSLIEAFMEDCIMMDKKRTPDGQGGFTLSWTEGITIKAAITLDTSMVSRLAEKQGVTSSYTVTTNKSVILDFHDVLKRVSDGRFFRITSNGDDKKTPAMSSFQVSQVTAENWELSQ